MPSLMLLRPALAGVLLMLVCGQALADSLMVSTGTVVLDDRNRAGSVGVAVPGPVASVVEIGVAAFAQDGHGRLSEVPVSDSPHAAAAFVRFGPRRFSVAPGRAADVRLAARPPADLPPGEYRMHLRVLNHGAQGTQPDEHASSARGVSVRIPVRVARGVRVLYRHRTAPEPGQLRNVRAETESASDWRLSFDVVRLGDTSLIARYQPFLRTADGERLAPWKEQGLNIYAEQAYRRIEQVLPAAGLPADATLCVRLVHTDPGAAGQAETEQCAG